MDKAMFDLAAHAAIYAGHDDPACQLRYRFLCLLADDPLYPVIEAEFRRVQIGVLEVTGRAIGETGWYLGLCDSRIPRATATREAYEDVMAWLRGKWREAGGWGEPIPIRWEIGFES